MIEDLLQQMVDRLDHRYYGKYRGYVHKVDDPLNQGRIQAIVPRLLGDTPTGWAMPCAPYAGPDQGFYTMPDLGTGVWIEFEEGDLARPIWVGTWWGRPEAADVGGPDSTARRPLSPEVPRHDHPREAATPGVRVLKSSTGHTITLDDRSGHERIEIEDSTGNRILLDKEGILNIVHNDRTVNKGNRSANIDGGDRLDVARSQNELIRGSAQREVRGWLKTTVGGDVEESLRSGAYKRTVDRTGTSIQVKGALTEKVSGSSSRTVTGAQKTTAIGGYGVSAGGSISMASVGAFNVAATLPDVPLLNTISLDALIGNISINTKLGLMQIGGLTAISPAVLGDGLAIHFAMLAQILKAVNPMTVAAYGPLLDAWAAMTPALDLSYFAFIKRFPVG